MSYEPEPVARILRKGIIESIHYGSAAVVSADGSLLYRIGDPYFVTYLRSSAKPFQAIPVVESGAAREFGFTSAEIAILTGSHSGSDIHVRTIQSILDKIGLRPEHLMCGSHPPINDKISGPPKDPGAQQSALQHNCSGKHAGMLALAVFKNLSTDDYLSPAHPVQQTIRKTVAEICCYPEDKIMVGIDGCSAPNHALPVYNMALGFARMATPNAVPREKAFAYSAVVMAMMEHPEMVAGDGRFDTTLISSAGEKLICKAGAEALECFAFVDRKLGAAVKVVDGTKRALFPTAVEFLYKMGVRSRTSGIDEFHRPVIKNWQGLDVGHIVPGFEIREVDHE